GGGGGGAGGGGRAGAPPGARDGRGEPHSAAKRLVIGQEAVELRAVLSAEDLDVGWRAAVRRHDHVVVAVRVEIAGGHVQPAPPARRERLEVVEQRPEALLAVEDLHARRGP